MWVVPGVVLGVLVADGCGRGRSWGCAGCGRT